MVNFRVLAISTVATSFEAYSVVPDVIPKAPRKLATAKYPSGVEAQEGNELTPTQAKDVPTVSWEFACNSFYTLAMTDPDVPSRASPILREFQHWLVGNIPGQNIYSGETLSEYFSPAPPAGTGFHRSVFLVYKQPGKLVFDEPRLTNRSEDYRANFSIAKFSEEYDLGGPVAGNFFQAQHDDYVSILNEQLDTDADMTSIYL